MQKQPKVLNKNDEIFNIYKQYIKLIYEDAEINNGRVYGVDQMASRLALAHVIHKVFQDEIAIDMNVPSTAKKVNKTWDGKLVESSEAEIMKSLKLKKV